MKNLITLFFSLLLFSLATQAQKDGDPCPGETIVMDPRDGNFYSTTRIGNQCWLRENASYLPRVHSGSDIFVEHPGYYVHDFFSDQLPQALINSNYRHYGAQYNWVAAQDACPAGWHLPSVEDVEQLMDHLLQEHGLSNEPGSMPSAAAALRSCRQVNSPLGEDCNTSDHPRWDESDFPGTDDFRFSALPGGYMHFSEFSPLGGIGYWWTSTQISPWKSYYFIIGSRSVMVNTSDNFSHPNSEVFSVRCMKEINPSSAQHTLILQSDPPQAGLPSGAGTYPEGRQVMIQARPYDNYVFIRWTRGQEVVSYSPWLLYTMPGEEVTLTAEYEPMGTVTDGQPCPGLEVVTDVRDGTTYNTVVMGNQCWLKENSRFWLEGADDPWAYSEPYNNYQEFNSDYLQAYGVLYNLPAALQACPDGWKLPSRYQWEQLFDYLISTYDDVNEQNISPYLKDCRQENSPQGGECNTNEHPRWDYWENFSGTDDFGFSALPGGYWSVTYVPNNFGGLGDYASFWTSSAKFPSETHVVALSAYHGSVSINHKANSKASSVRCVREGNYLPTPTRIEHEHKPEALIYPNPTQNLLWLEFQSDAPVVVSLYNVQGIRVQQFAVQHSPLVKMSLNLAGLSSGIYFVLIQSRSLNVMQKVIKLP